MKEFAQQFLELTGVTLAAALAAMFGGIAGLAFAVKPTPRQALVIVLAGIGTGSFGSAALIGYFGIAPILAAPFSFFLGFLAMPILGFAFGLASRLRDRSGNIADRAADKVLGKDDANPRHPEAP